ncbi:translocation protein SEC62 [Dermacentor albipictus]|uniref:translocation protein SEC62 n=1 Tax=Dermacentor albipictus TaxID=60249 RepID=UPI0031FBD689
MAQVERRKGRKKREKDAELAVGEKPAKVEYDVARYLREKLPIKKTTLLSHKVEYFNAAKAVDCLLDSPWATGKPKVEQLFTTRESVVEFMDTLIQHKFFHRAKKIIVTKPKKKKDDDDTGGGTPKATKEKKKKDEVDGSASKEGTEEKKEVEEIKKKLKLDMHLDQYFVDANEPYVWIYDPVPLRTWIIGTLLVVGAVAVCLFPLWPRTVRDYVYYLSIATAFLLGIIISLAFFRQVLFVIIWACTLGRHHFWLLPNLTEDVGFVESFWPIYQYEYKGPSSKDSKAKDSKAKKKKQDDDDGGDATGKGDQSASEDSEEKRSSDHNGGQGDSNGFELVDSPVEDEGGKEKMS